MHEYAYISTHARTNAGILSICMQAVINNNHQAWLIYLSIYLSIHSFNYLSIYKFSKSLFIYSFIYQFISLCFHLFISLMIYSFIFTRCSQITLLLFMRTLPLQHTPVPRCTPSCISRGNRERGKENKTVWLMECVSQCAWVMHAHTASFRFLFLTHIRMLTWISFIYIFPHS